MHEGKARRDAVGPLHRARASRRARSCASSAALRATARRAGEVVLRSVRARRVTIRGSSVHGRTRATSAGKTADRRAQARAAVLDLRAGRGLARLSRATRRLRDGRPEQAHAADARASIARPASTWTSACRRPVVANYLREQRDRAGEVRPQQHPVPDDAGGGRKQAQHADREARQVQEPLGPRRAARAKCCRRSYAQHSERYAGYTLRQVCNEMHDFYTRGDVKELQKLMLPRLPASRSSRCRRRTATRSRWSRTTSTTLPLRRHRGPHRRDARADLSARHRRRRPRRALGRERSRCSTTSWPSRNRSTASRLQLRSPGRVPGAGVTAASVPHATWFAE